MDRIKKSDSPLIRQYKLWAKDLLGVNPSYVTTPGKLVWYIKGPNWDDPDMEYAHYRSTVGIYGDELLKKFEYIRSLPEEQAEAEYAALMKIAGITEKE